MIHSFLTDEYFEEDAHGTTKLHNLDNIIIVRKIEFVFDLILKLNEVFEKDSFLILEYMYHNTRAAHWHGMRLQNFSLTARFVNLVTGKVKINSVQVNEICSKLFNTRNMELWPSYQRLIVKFATEDQALLARTFL